MPESGRRCEKFILNDFAQKIAKNAHEMKAKILYGNELNGRSYERCPLRKFDDG